jgi:hypothetical protein
MDRLPSALVSSIDSVGANSASASRWGSRLIWSTWRRCVRMAAAMRRSPAAIAAVSRMNVTVM